MLQGIEVVTRGCKRLHGLKGATKAYRGFQEVTTSYSG